MAILEENNTRNSEEIRKKKKTILALLIFLSVILLVLLLMIAVIPNNDGEITQKYKFDGKEIQLENVIVETEDGNKYAGLKDLADLLEYTYCNGGYLEYSEDKTKCYIESEAEVVGFEESSRQIYKLDKTSTAGYEYYQLENPIIMSNEKLYINIIDLAKALNLIVKETPAVLEIDTPLYIIEKYKDTVTKSGYASIDDTARENLKLLAYDMMVVTKASKKGVINFNMEEVIGTKYDTMVFSEQTNEFIVSNNGKYGIITATGEIKGKMIYDSLTILNNKPRLYLVEIEKEYGVLDEYGNIAIEIKYNGVGYQDTIFIENLNNYGEEYIVVEKEGKYGLINLLTGKIILACDLDAIYETQDGGISAYIVEKDGEKYLLKEYVKNHSLPTNTSEQEETTVVVTT